MDETHSEDLTHVSGDGSVFIEADEGSFAVKFTYFTDDHGLHLTAYSVTSSDGRSPLTRALRREVERDLQRWAEGWHAEAIAKFLGTTHLGAGTLTLGTGPDAVSAQLEDARITERDPALVEAIRHQLAYMHRPRRNQRSLEDETFLAEVAAVYLAAEAKPTQAVADKYNVTRSQASRYVRAARAASLIPPLDSGAETED